MSQVVEPRRRFRLRTVGGVLTELARVYRAGWDGSLTWQDAACAARILKEIRVAIEGGEFERRLVAIEERLGAASKPRTARTAASGLGCEPEFR
jgi:hypothetical protein